MSDDGPPKQLKPIERGDCVLPPPEAVQAWKEVQERLDEEKPVPASSAKIALRFGLEYYERFKEASQFVKMRMHAIIRPFLEQESSENLSGEIEECLKLSSELIAIDLIGWLGKDNDTLLVDLLAPTTKYYQHADDGYATRLRVLDTFCASGGLSRLADYIPTWKRATRLPQAFPILHATIVAGIDVVNFQKPVPRSSIETLRNMLNGVADRSFRSTISKILSALAVASVCTPTDERGVVFSLSNDKRKEIATHVTKIVFDHLCDLSFEHLEEEEHHFYVLERIFNSLTLAVDYWSTEDICSFFDKTCELMLRHVKSENSPLKDIAWKIISKLIIAACGRDPPTKTVSVSNAGSTLINGTYSYVDDKRGDGNVVLRTARYQRVLPNNLRDTGDEHFIFSVLDNEGFTWFLWNEKEATCHWFAESVDGIRPPLDGWKSWKDGKEAPLIVQCDGDHLPAGAEHDRALEQQVSEWAITNNIVEVLCEEPPLSKSSVEHVGALLRFLASKSKRASIGDRTGRADPSKRFYLQASHVLLLWQSRSLPNHDVDTVFLNFLVDVLYYLSDEIAIHLLEAVEASLESDLSRVELFLVCVIHRVTRVSLFASPLWSKAVQTNMKRLSWRARTHPGTTVLTGEILPNICEILTKLENSPVHSKSVTSTIQEKRTPRKAFVSIIDAANRQIQVSMPVESMSGEWFMGMRVYAVQESRQHLVASIDRDVIEDCIIQCGENVTVKVVLPGFGLWYIEWHGLLLRKDIVETPRSAQTEVDLNAKDAQHQKRLRADVGAMDEQARKCAGDILAAIQKLRGPCSSKLDVSSKFSLLHRVMSRGRSTWDKLNRLVQKAGYDVASAPGIDALSLALAKATPTMTELETAFKKGNKKNQIKSFKNNVMSILENGDDAPVWLESVQLSDLESQGGETNLLFQLLVDAASKETKRESAKLNWKPLEAASARTDLFSKKQINKLLALQGERNPSKPTITVTGSAESLVEKKHTSNAPATVLQRRPLEPLAITPRLENLGEVQPSIVAPTHGLSDDPLLSFLKEQHSLLKGSPEAFYKWLCSSQDILTLDDVAEAVTDDDYLKNVLRYGDGTVGVKGFKLGIFKKKALGAAIVTTHANTCLEKENAEPPSAVICPLSKKPMTNDPVTAADGITYELTAIAEWFHRLNGEVEAAKQELSSGNFSKKAKAIVDRGIVSPVTNERIHSFALAPNQKVRQMARNSCKQS